MNTRLYKLHPIYMLQMYQLEAPQLQLCISIRFQPNLLAIINQLHYII